MRNERGLLIEGRASNAFVIRNEQQYAQLGDSSKGPKYSNGDCRALHAPARGLFRGSSLLSAAGEALAAILAFGLTETASFEL
jgi:hypothetical protein